MADLVPDLALGLARGLAPNLVPDLVPNLVPDLAPNLVPDLALGRESLYDPKKNCIVLFQIICDRLPPRPEFHPFTDT